MPLIRALSLAGLLSLAPAALASELIEPAISAEAVDAPRIAADPARPPGAPTAEAIDTTTREDGAAAGLALAGKALAASRAAYGPQDLRTLVPLGNVAHARQRSGDLAGALLDYRKVIELGESAAGPRDPRLIDAWYGAGYAQLAAGQYGAAAEALQTALQLHRINHGLYSDSQLGVLHALAVALRAQGKAEDADEVQLRRLNVAERLHGAGTPDVLREYLAVGRWFRNVGRVFDAISLHAMAVEIAEKRSKEDPALIDPLIELALSGGEYRRGPDDPPLVGALPPGPALARAERLAEGHAAGTPAERAAALIRIGDVHYGQGRRDPALRVYAKATALLAGIGQPPPFDAPVFVSLRLPRPAALEGPGGYVLAEFGVEPGGRTRDVRIVEVRPNALPDTVSSQLSSAIRSARLRPRIVNGQPVASSGQRFRLPIPGGPDP